MTASRDPFKTGIEYRVSSSSSLWLPSGMHRTLEEVSAVNVLVGYEKYRAVES